MAKKKTTYSMVETLFIYPSETANWHFLPITRKHGQDIKEKFGANSRGFGSLPVEVTIGESVWNTSVFPSKSSGSYILPIKAKVRRAEDIEAGEKVQFSIRLRV